MKNYSETYQYLMEHDIKPSMQRMAVMNYLRSVRTHPSADEIYQEVKQICPTLSKTTVYNTLRLFAEHDAALMLTIDETKACFDGFTHPHAHFICRECGNISDIDYDQAEILKNANLPAGMEVDNVELSFRGVCPKCRQKTN